MTKPLLTAVDKITTTKLRNDLIQKLEQNPLRLSEIINTFSSRLPSGWDYERKDRYFDSLLQKMKREGQIVAVQGRWMAV